MLSGSNNIKNINLLFFDEPSEAFIFSFDVPSAFLFNHLSITYVNNYEVCVIQSLIVIYIGNRQNVVIPVPSLCRQLATD